jgi:glycosyltransferase involved in cell wall biosynthesis
MTAAQGRRPRIVINALSARAGGGVTYARNLLRHLPDPPPADVHVLVAPERRRVLPEGPFTLVECPFAGRNVVTRTLWERFGAPRLLRELGADVYYVLSGTVVGRLPEGCRSVVAFRNLLPFSNRHRKLYPPGYIRFRLWLLRFTQGRSFARADLVIFISEHGRSVIDGAVPRRRGRSVLIPHGVGDGFFPAAPATGDPRWPGGYVLYVSILDVYKAQLEVVRAWAAVRARRRTPEKLVLAGPAYPPYGRRVEREIDALGLGDEVVLLGPVPHGQLEALYQNAKLGVFASRCENCPNILLESLAAGRPILCSSDPPMPEFGGDAVEYFDPTQPQQLADLLCEVLDDEARLAGLSARASARAQRYRLRPAMQATWNALVDLACC